MLLWEIISMFVTSEKKKQKVSANEEKEEWMEDYNWKVQWRSVESSILAAFTVKTPWPMKPIEERVYLGLTILEGVPMPIMVGSMAAGRWGTVTVAGIHEQDEEQ